MLNFGKNDVIGDVNFALGVDFLVLIKSLRCYIKKLIKNMAMMTSPKRVMTLV